MAMDIGNPPHLVSPPSSNEIENLNKGRSEITFEMRAPTSSQQFPVSIESVTIDKKKNDGVLELYHCVKFSNRNICSQRWRVSNHVGGAREPERDCGGGRHLHPRVLRQQVHPLLRLAAQGAIQKWHPPFYRICPHLGVISVQFTRPLLIRGCHLWNVHRDKTCKLRWSRTKGGLVKNQCRVYDNQGCNSIDIWMALTRALTQALTIAAWECIPKGLPCLNLNLNSIPNVYWIAPQIEQLWSRFTSLDKWQKGFLSREDFLRIPGMQFNSRHFGKCPKLFS